MFQDFFKSVKNKCLLGLSLLGLSTLAFAERGDKQFHARRQNDRKADARQPTEIACGCKRNPTATHPPRNLRRDSDRAESPPCDSPG